MTVGTSLPTRREYRREHERRRPGARILSVFTIIVLAAVSLLALLTAVIPFALGAQSYTVLTGSMRPGLEPGHLIAVRPVSIDDVRAGDVVTFQLRSGEPEVATHRVVGITAGGDGTRLLITQGDANNVRDAEPVRAEQLRGVMVYAIPYLGYVNVWASPATKSAIVTLVGGAAVAYGLSIVIRGEVRRRAARAAPAAAVVVAVIACGSVFAPAPAQAAAVTAPAATAPTATAQTVVVSRLLSAPASGSGLLVSVDGERWSEASRIDLFDGAEVLSPGDTVSRTLWVRNASTVVAVPRLAGRWEPADVASASDRSLAVALRVGIGGTASSWTGEPLDPGDDIAVEVSATLPSETVDAQMGRAVLALTVSLTETAGPGLVDPDDPLAGTGGTIPVFAILFGVVAVGGGLVLLAVRRRDPSGHSVSPSATQR